MKENWYAEELYGGEDTSNSSFKYSSDIFHRLQQMQSRQQNRRPDDNIPAQWIIQRDNVCHRNVKNGRCPGISRVVGLRQKIYHSRVPIRYFGFRL